MELNISENSIKKLVLKKKQVVFGIFS